VLYPDRRDSIVTKDSPGIAYAPLPVDAAALTIGLLVPGCDFPSKESEIADSARAKALSADQTDFHLCRIEPTGVLGCVMHGEPPPEALALELAEVIGEGLLGVGAQIVEHEVNGACALVVPCTFSLLGRRRGQSDSELRESGGVPHAVRRCRRCWRHHGEHTQSVSTRWC
jgi:hypothetical protein